MWLSSIDGTFNASFNGLAKTTIAPGFGADATYNNGFIVTNIKTRDAYTHDNDPGDGATKTIIDAYFDSFNEFSWAALTVINVAAEIYVITKILNQLVMFFQFNLNLNINLKT